MTTDSKASQQLAKALSEMIVRAPAMEPTDVIAGFDDIETRFLSVSAKSERIQLETKRRVAEWKFKVLSERDLPSENIEPLYDAVRKLGFTDLDTEGIIEIYLAQYRIRQSRVPDARKILETLLQKLGSSPAYDQLRQNVARLLSSLKE